MKLFRKKKTLKGMTLIECIIALAVLAIAATVMARIVSVSCNVMKNTTRMNNKIVVEAPAAIIQDGDYVEDVVTNNVDSAGNALPARVSADGMNHDVDDVVITVSAGGSSTSYRTKKYDTWALAQASDRDCYTSNDPTQSQRDGNLQFYRPDGNGHPDTWDNAKIDP